ncbi:catabolite control protein A [Limosilactobacillus secaliphilus]|uniref:Catabolite control protein A n=1 Tax=Limosilactobacillus secaliphilus TaxID=396268 RepID=A0A0R2IB32_9LACO|nr:catabolite control protein A [Limosilactobacillus secaliphilus]KRN59383.1 catabolite control protein A [Limosilactobacillus secaliphilus]
MEKQSVTIYTVAREANVSMATVSRVVNGNQNVKPETRDKVLAVIKKLNYRPNAVARGLASKKTTTIGVVIPDITNDYFAELALGIDDIATMYKYNMILTNSDADGSSAIKVVQNLFAKQVDGVIFMGHDIEDQLQAEFSKATVPVVVAGSLTNDKNIPSVRIDYEQATKEAVSFLLKHGNKKVALLIGSRETTINKFNRIPGYKAALKQAHVKFNDSLVFEADDSYENGYKLAKQMVKKGITAAFVSDDSSAAGLLNGLTDSNVKVPEDFEIITGNDTKLATITRPTLTSITQPLYDVGAVAMRLLTKLMSNDNDDEEKQPVILQHGFEERQSTR